MIADQLTSRFIGEAKQALAEIAEDAMLFPKSEPFGHGEQVGKYQGLKFALEILEDLMRDNLEKERNS